MLRLASLCNLRCFSVTAAFRRSHYDALGLSSSATQADVKEAYYKLSMLYHPDKTNSESSVEKFRDITEAYEVLGNVRLRKLYDKGVGSVRTPGDDVVNKFYKSREKRTRPPTTGRTPIYDFDEWSRQHYTATFMKERERKQNFDMHQSAARNEQHNIEMGRVILLMAFVFIFLIYKSSETRHLDRPSLKGSSQNQLQNNDK